jgi:hypothetical protein
MKWFYWILIVIIAITASVLGTWGIMCRSLKTSTSVAQVASTPTPTATATPVAVPTPEPSSTLGKPGHGFVESAYLGISEAHVYSFSQPRKDKDLSVVILPNFDTGRAFVVGDDGEMPKFTYHGVQPPEGFVPVAHPTWKDVEGRNFIVFAPEPK